ncbi:MAG: DUF5301 domain-containing protein [Lachnospiraceae bacterium]|nr:DUF5301 domain-containing protein [Lachnospiraceae bacterium]
MKKIVSILVVVMIIASLAGCSQKAADPIVLPDENSIQSVDITVDDELVNFTDIEWIKQCMSNIANAQATAKESVNDMPQVDDYIKIDINTNNAVSTLFVYEKNDKYYIEQAYQGIYETDSSFYEMLKELK